MTRRRTWRVTDRGWTVLTLAACLVGWTIGWLLPLRPLFG